MSTVDRGERHGGSDSRGESGWICLMMGWRYCHLLNTRYLKTLKLFFLFLKLCKKIFNETLVSEIIYSSDGF